MKTMKSFLMAALALTFAACSSEGSDILTTPQPAEAEGIPFTATISIDKGAATRALEEDGTAIKATWADNEEVALIYSAGGTATKTDAKVTKQTDGTATISATLASGATDGSEVTIIYPATAADGATGDVKSDLLSAQNGTLTGTGSIAENFDVRKGTGKLSISGGTATVNNGTPGTTVSLANQFAIFKFTLGSAIDNTHPLTIKDEADNVITTVTPTSSRTEVFVALAPATSKYYKFSATTSENKIISKSSTATIAAGNYYQTTLACPALGDLFYSDGTYSTTLQAGKTAIGVIAYLGTDNFTENGTTVGGSAFVGHGLVLCLKNAASGADAQWSTETSTLEFGDDAKVTDATGLKRTTNVSGYTNTKTLAEKDGAATKYKAAYAAKNYTGLTAPASTTGWFLPSAQQWVKMQTGLGALDESSITFDGWFDNSHTAADKWEAALQKVGSGNYDSMTSEYLYYWSSSENSANLAVRLNVDATNTGGDYGFVWRVDRKDNNTNSSYRVRPVLAF